MELFQKKKSLSSFQIIIFGTITHYIANFLSSEGLPLFFVLAISYGLYLLILLGLNYKRIIGCLKKLNTYK